LAVGGADDLFGSKPMEGWVMTVWPMRRRPFYERGRGGAEVAPVSAIDRPTLLAIDHSPTSTIVLVVDIATITTIRSWFI
jgi:hypothetical protein